MTSIISILGILCLGYYIFLISLRMDFAAVWLVAGLGLLTAAGVYMWLTERNAHLPVWFKGGVGVILALGIGIFLVAEALIISGMSEKGEPNLDYVIVLGAQVRGDHPSRALRHRIETAAKYLNDNSGTIAILSGGQGPGENMTEAVCMRDELVKLGIEEERLILEERSTSTKENLIYSAELAPVKESRIGLITQNFHVFRSRKLAAHQNYKNICGIAAPSEFIYQPHFMVREAFALVKEKIVGNI